MRVSVEGVSVGDEAMTATGTVVTSDVPEGAMDRAGAAFGGEVRGVVLPDAI